MWYKRKWTFSELYIISIRRIINDWHLISSGYSCKYLWSIYYCSIFNYTSDHTSYFCLPSLDSHLNGSGIKHQQFVRIYPKRIWVRIRRESFTSSWFNLVTNKIVIIAYHPIIFSHFLRLLKEKFNRVLNRLH